MARRALGLPGGRVVGLVAALAVAAAVVRRPPKIAEPRPRDDGAALAAVPAAPPPAPAPRVALSIPVGLIRGIASDYKAIASLVGLLVYGIVRVAYDAYYARLGVFPEAVGLTETTILGRAVLYLALTSSVAAIVGGAWFGIARWGVRRSRTLTPPRIVAAIAAPAALAAALVVAAREVREILGTREFAYYCFARCKFQPLDPATLDELRATAARLGSEHPGYGVLALGPAWLVGLPLVFLAAAAASAALLGREEAQASRRAALATFASLAAAAFAAGALAPHLRATFLDAATRDPSSPLLEHASVLAYATFVLLLVAIGAGLVAAVSRLQRPDERASPWPVASFIVVLPLLAGFLEPGVPRFVQEEGLWPVLAALVLWLALLAACFVVWPDLVRRRLGLSPALAFLVAVLVTMTLFLAWHRGLNLAKQAAMGDQIHPERFSVLSVRANVVCLERSGIGATMLLRRQPYTYLGQADGTLILYDYLADRANELPRSFPVRLPAGDAVVRLARYDAADRAWSCGPAAR